MSIDERIDVGDLQIDILYHIVEGYSCGIADGAGAYVLTECFQDRKDAIRSLLNETKALQSSLEKAVGWIEQELR